MRIHHLEITSFGPFSGSETIDFDLLTDAGLFLLCGATGAGKTSVLDAICFGLYGEVPGDRNSAKRLRSDHSAPGVAPAVLLEVSITARRFRIARSPTWDRPKRRGTGVARQQARVNLEEYVDGAWLHLSNRLDETGHLITGLLGMNLTQFCQVAMLPQGRFQSFLRAKSDERHKVLQQLFRTSRFEDIERWLVAHRQSLKNASRSHQEAVASVVSRISEAAAADVPLGWDLHELAVPAEQGEVSTWSTELVSTAASAKRQVGVDLKAVTEQVAHVRAVVQQAHTTAELRERHQEALRTKNALAADQAQADAARQRLDAARRAAAVLPLLRVATQADHAADAAQRSLRAGLADAARILGADPPTLTADNLAVAEREAHEAASIAKALLPREAELEHAQLLLERSTASLAEHAAEAGELDERRKAIPPEVADLRTLLCEQAALAGDLEAVKSRDQHLVTQLESARKVVALGNELVSARTQLGLRVDQAQGLREHMHDVREARINGMAAELALSLASGGSCPVCGSADHPSVARPVAGAPTQLDEEDARTAFEDADFVRQAQAEAVTALERNHAVAEQSADGKSIDALRSEIAVVGGLLTGCRAAGPRHQRLADQIAVLEEEQESLRRRSDRVQTGLVRLTQEAEQARTTIDKVSAELSALFDQDDIADSVERLIQARSAAGAAFAIARDALDARDTSLARAQEARHHASECATEHGFDTVEAASARALSHADVEALEELLRARDEMRVGVDSVLADPRVQAAATATPPDLAALEELRADSERTLVDCGARSRVASDRADRLSRLHAELTDRLDSWAPTRSAYALAQTISTFVEGKGGDNALQMRLSAYVLAERLKQVVAAANERLSTMSDQRYTLEHSAARGVGELRGGLSLLIRDSWTGESRDPATLSGGETFVASLALALGLADVVTHEAGGSNIDTLFIDEGFGTLDPDTLDDVMDTLDGLREGGRAVGIVSHVPQMRTRVTAQLQIHKGRSGSTVVAAREAV